MNSSQFFVDLKISFQRSSRIIANFSLVVAVTLNYQCPSEWQDFPVILYTEAVLNINNSNCLTKKKKKKY